MESFFEGTSVEMYFARRRNRDIGICLCNIAEKLTVIKLRLSVTQNASATIETPWTFIKSDVFSMRNFCCVIYAVQLAC